MPASIFKKVLYQMDDLLKDDEFAQFIFTQYFKDKNLNTKEMIYEVTKSYRDYLLALEAFKSQSLPRH